MLMKINKGPLLQNNYVRFNALLYHLQRNTISLRDDALSLLFILLVYLILRSILKSIYARMATPFFISFLFYSFIFFLSSSPQSYAATLMLGIALVIAIFLSHQEQPRISCFDTLVLCFVSPTSVT